MCKIRENEAEQLTSSTRPAVLTETPRRPCRSTPAKDGAPIFLQV